MTEKETVFIDSLNPKNVLIIAVALALTVITVVLLITNTHQRSSDNTRKKVEACVSSGNEWVQNKSNTDYECRKAG